MIDSGPIAERLTLKENVVVRLIGLLLFVAPTTGSKFLLDTVLRVHDRLNEEAEARRQGDSGMRTERLRDRLAARADRIAWTNLVEDTKAMWEPHGFRVFVNSDERRIVITRPTEVLNAP